MSPGELESLRTEGEQHGLSRRETLTLLEHLDAVADQRNVAMSRLFDSEKARNEITADRDEARQEVAALRAQRDEIREAHRVDEEERDSDALRRMATLAVEAQKKLSTLTEAVAWYLELRARDAGSNGAQAEGYANTLRAAHDDLTSLVDGEPATARAAHLDTLTARLEAAERERGELRAEVVTLRADLEEWRRSHREAESLADQAKRRRERTLETVEARADAAEAKLAAIDAPFLGGALHHIEMLHADQRESRDREEALVLKLDAAEAKLAALVEAVGCLDVDPSADVAAIEAALRAARGEL